MRRSEGLGSNPRCSRGRTDLHPAHEYLTEASADRKVAFTATTRAACPVLGAIMKQHSAFFPHKSFQDKSDKDAGQLEGGNAMG